MKTIAQTLAQARASGIDGLDARVLLAYALHCEITWLLAHDDAPVDRAQASRFQTLVERRRAGEPVAYLTGERLFFGLPFHVSPAALIPRPETEHLVEAALEWARSRGRVRIADVGTGSGAIAVSLAVHLPETRVVATDRSRPALRVAAQNVARHHLDERVSLVQADLTAPLRPPFDLIASNPPYIPTSQLAQLEVARHEPRAALDGGRDGLAVIRHLLADAPRLLARPGLLLVEIGAGQAPAVCQLAGEIFHEADVSVVCDYGGHERVLRVALEGTA